MKNDIKYFLPKYFAIYKDRVFRVANFDLTSDLENCFYIMKYGSKVNPRIYLREKKNGKWLIENRIINGYSSLIRFVVENQENFMLFGGFSRANIGELIVMINELKETDIKQVAFKKRIKRH